MPLEDDSPTEVLRRVTDDQVSAARLRAAYNGLHDPIDALTWRVNPGSLGPSGAVDPSASLAPLQARVFGREAQQLSDVDRADLEGSLSRLMADIAAERVALDAALSRVRFDDPAAEEEPGFPLPVVRVAPRIGILRGALASLALAAVVAATVTVAVAPTDSLAVFDLPAAEGDPAPPDWLLQARSVESSAVRWIGDARGWDVFVLMENSGHVCMTVVNGDRGTGSCLTPAAFAAHGISVELPLESGPGFYSTPNRNVASWGPVGGLRVQIGLPCTPTVYPC